MTEAIYYNALNILFESGYGTLAKLKNRYSSWQDSWKNCVRDGKSNVSPETEYEKLTASGAKLVLREERDYPRLLSEIPQPPFGIYVLGSLPAEKGKSLAIVGTRKATSEGKNIARQFAKVLAERGLTIVSGLAFGIDAAAHEGCLDAKGATVAVLGCGVNYFYPRTNERLAKRIVAGGGAIISEYPVGSPPLPYRFLERNRVVSGLSRGVLVIEAPRESGALVTGRHALDQNRDVFVVPGPISHPNYIGSNQLIRRGAELVASPEEILESWGIETDSASGVEVKFDNEAEKVIFEILRGSTKPLDANAIAETAKIEISEANKTLTFMIVKGIVKEAGGGYAIS